MTVLRSILNIHLKNGPGSFCAFECLKELVTALAYSGLPLESCLQ